MDMPRPNANQGTGTPPEEKATCFSPLGLAGLLVALSPVVAGAFPMFAAASADSSTAGSGDDARLGAGSGSK